MIELCPRTPWSIPAGEPALTNGRSSARRLKGVWRDAHGLCQIRRRWLRLLRRCDFTSSSARLGSVRSPARLNRIRLKRSPPARALGVSQSLLQSPSRAGEQRAFAFSANPAGWIARAPRVQSPISFFGVRTNQFIQGRCGCLNVSFPTTDSEGT
jgi:hypothetical protein